MNSFTIKDLENLSGIKAHTIRIWEQRYSLFKPERTETNIRYYSCEELKKILNIALLNKYGYKISHIDKMCEQEISEKILSLSRLQAQQECIVSDLIKCMVDIDTEKFEQVLQQCIKTKGIEKTIVQIIFPYLERIGILWLTNHINPAQEHIITNLVRQKLIAGIENIPAPDAPGKKMLLFLPEGEHHELGLLFMYYMLKKRGINVIYLGANIPLRDVVFVAGLKQPDHMYIHLTTVGGNFNFDKFLSNLSQRFVNIDIVISGQITCTYEKKIPPSITFKRSFAEVMHFVEGL